MREYKQPAGEIINSDYHIEKNIPMVPFQSSRNFSKYPFHFMEIGDSFAADLAEQQRIRVQAAGHKPKKFTVRKVSDSMVRVWRTR